jgi:hypothetical protein
MDLRAVGQGADSPHWRPVARRIRRRIALADGATLLLRGLALTLARENRPLDFLLAQQDFVQR